MKMKFLIILAAFTALSEIGWCLSNPGTLITEDTIKIKIGDTSEVKLIIKNPEDLELLKKYDLNSMISDLDMQLDQSGEGTENIVIEDTVGEKYLNETAEDASSVIVEDDGDTNYLRQDDEVNKTRSRRYRGYGTTHSLNLDFGLNNYLENGRFPDESGEPYTVKPWAAALNGSSLQLTAADGRDIIVGETVTLGGAGGVADGTGGATTTNGVTFKDGTIGTVANATAQSADTAAVNGGALTLTANENVIVTGDGDDMGFSTVNKTIALDTSTLADVDVLSVVNATSALGRIDSALNVVSTLRSELGAIQNRFESTIANLGAVSESLSASRSRIQDADFAAETSSLIRAQILQQAGVSVLSQANAQPQLALSLLQ